MTPLQKIQLKNQTERVLHVPGSYSGGILEMTIVFDYSLPLEVLQSLSKELVTTLKQSSPIFRNVRLNTIKWIADDEYNKELSSFPSILIGREFSDYSQSSADKHLDELTRQLKTFYARSKLIYLISDTIKAADASIVKANLQPFLGRKLLILHSDGSCCGLSAATL